MISIIVESQRMDVPLNYVSMEDSKIKLIIDSKELPEIEKIIDEGGEVVIYIRKMENLEGTSLGEVDLDSQVRIEIVKEKVGREYGGRANVAIVERLKKRAEQAESALQGAKALVTQYRDELRDACDMKASNEPTALGMMRERAEKAEQQIDSLVKTRAHRSKKRRLATPEK